MSPSPNIVFILSDQHRRDWMGCAGSRLVITPNLDGLAAKGIRFSQAYCNSPLCGPSRMSLLSGRHPYRNRVYTNEDVLDSNAPTFAHALGLAGYETVLCGRMHMTGLDQRHGFQKRLVGDICRTLPGGRAADYGHLEGTSGNARIAVAKAGPGESPVLQFDEDVTRAFERLVRERQGQDAKRPLFVTVGWYGPHHPFTAPQDLYDEALARMVRQDDEPLPANLKHPWLDMHSGLQNLEINPERIREVRANYAAMIDLMDQRIGRILKAAENLPGDTIIIYASDHGEMALDHELIGKGCFFEPSVGVPLIISPLIKSEDWVGGAVVDTPVSLVDLAPTLADLGCAPALPQGDGLSLTPCLGDPCDKSIDWANRAIFSELSIAYAPQRAMRMIRRGRFKFCYFHGFPPLLIDLLADPQEQVNLADIPEYASLVADIQAAALRDWDPAAVEADATERLREMKFIQTFDRQFHSTDWHEAWNPQQPVFEFGRSGEPLSKL